jgi:hypothetical protein
MEPLVRTLVVCPDCSEVSVSVADVTLRVCVDDLRWSYCFVCPSCELRAAGSTNQRAALEAIEAGAAFESWRLPADLYEQHDGPDFQLMDVLELQLELTRSDWIDAL